MGYNCEAAINRWNNTALHNHFLSQGTHLLYLEHPHYPNFFLHLNTFIRGYSQNQPDFLTLPEQWQLNILQNMQLQILKLCSWSYRGC